MFRQKRIQSFLLMILFISAATGIGWLFRILKFPETNIVVVYILFVVLTARFTKGYFYGVAASVIATFAFNMFFTAPYFTLSVDNPTYFITFAIMTITSVITSTLTAKVKQNVEEARKKEAVASTLYHLTNRLTDAKNIEEAACILVRAVSKLMNCRAACICFDEKGEPEKSFIQQRDEEVQVRRSLEHGAELKRQLEEATDSYIIGTEFYDWPIRGKACILGGLRIPRETAQSLLESQKKILRSMIESTAFAMERFRNEQERIKAGEEIAQERSRGNMLRAISHDLRTPLSGIMGTSEMLMSMSPKEDERYQLAENIYEAAGWLHSLVENILNLTRMQDGKLILEKQMEVVEEVLEMAVTTVGKRAPERDIQVEIPEEILLVPMDAKLIGQVLVNLLDNAIKHTTKEDEIKITVSSDREKELVVFEVADRGSGISETDLPNIFQMFYTSAKKGADTRRGIGLGLAICETIIMAHGGTIQAYNRTDGPGARFVFTLPKKGEETV